MAFEDFYDETVAKAFELARLLTDSTGQAEALVVAAYRRARVGLADLARSPHSPTAWLLAELMEATHARDAAC